MPLIHMVLADSDFQYVNHLSQWFIENKSLQFQISAFTEKESFLKFLSQKENEIDIILAEEKFFIGNTEPKDICVVLGKASKLINLPVIKKFQSASSLCSDVLSLISNEQSEAIKWHMSGKSELVTCFSPNTYLKSTISILISLLSSDYIYINTESFPYFEMHESNQMYSKNLSDILYHIKAEKGNPLMTLESSIVTSNNQIQFIPPIDNPTDIWELSEKETDTFIEALTTWGHFSKIILDIECNTSPMIIKLFEVSSYIIIPFDKTQTHQVVRLKNMMDSILGLSNDKVKWVFCGEGRHEYFNENTYFEFPWLHSYISDFNDFSLDAHKISQLATLFL